MENQTLLTQNQSMKVRIWTKQKALETIDECQKVNFQITKTLYWTEIKDKDKLVIELIPHKDLFIVRYNPKYFKND